MNILEIIAIDPYVGDILAETKPSRRARYRVYEQVKERLSAHVGWGAFDDRLRTSAAYSIVMQEVVKRMRV